MHRHKIDNLRCDRLGGTYQIAFVLTILVVHQHNHLTGLNICNHFFNWTKMHTLAPKTS